MKISVRRAVAAFASLACVAGSFAPVAAADYIQSAPAHYDQVSQACSEGWVLSRISHKFHYQVGHVPNLPSVDIMDFRQIHETRYQPAYEDSPIARRYCEATAYMSDGRRHQVWYLIEDGMGFAGVGGHNVEFCLVGFDRWKVYNGRCRVLR